MKVIKKSNSIKNRLKKLQRSAKKRNISVNLNEHHYSELLKLGCVYCGEYLLDEEGYCLDRHDNDKGYHFENVSPCCKICNRAKGTMNNEDFLAWVGRASKFQKEMIEKVKNMNKFNLKKQINIFKNKSGYKNSNCILLKGDR